MKRPDPEKEPKTDKAIKKGHLPPPEQPELADAPIEEPYGKHSGSKPPRVPGEKSPGATPRDRD